MGAAPDFAALRDAIRNVRAEALERPELRNAAVLVPVVAKPAGFCMLFTQRSLHVDAHRGEISFPGGAIDDGDASHAAAALREAWEEVGLPPDAVEVLGELSDIATRSGFLVRPVVGVVRSVWHWQPNQREVAAIIEVPLTAIADPAAWKHVPRLYQERLIPGSYFEYGEHVVWGATARILRQFAEVCFAERFATGGDQWTLTPATR